MWRFIAAAILLISTVLLLVRLGHYSLWDDEANTALIGQGVWRTGDTSALLDHNIVAYRGGGELSGLKARYVPPLQYYVVAPFVGLFPANAFVARLPFALAGLAAIAMLLWWTSTLTRDPLHWTLLGIAIIANVALFLYLRQCRYYALAISTTVAIALLYYRWPGRWRDVVVMSILLFLLLAANYLNFLAVVLCLAVDYAIWGRLQFRIRWQHAVAIFVPVAILGAIVVLIWNPWGKSITMTERGNWFAEHATLLWWNLRDMNRNEFGVGLVLLAAPVVAALVPRARFILRLVVAAVVFILVTSFFSPQPVSITTAADVRYLAPLIPLLIVIQVMVIAVVANDRWSIAMPLAAVFLLTNLGNGGVRTGPNPREDPGQIKGFSSTLTRFIGELITPTSDPYSVAIKWVNENVKSGESVLVWPDFMLYPLMFHSPHPIYAYQLPNPAPKDNPALANFPPIHYRGNGLPDHVIAFGPGKTDLFQKHGFPGEPIFVKAAQYDVYWVALHRPELMWRDFYTVEKFDKAEEGVYIYSRGNLRR